MYVKSKQINNKVKESNGTNYNSNVESFLPESTGRYRNDPLQERCCVLCKDRSFKDEKHFFLTANVTKQYKFSSFYCVNLDKNSDGTSSFNQG